MKLFPRFFDEVQGELVVIVFVELAELFEHGCAPFLQFYKVGKLCLTWEVTLTWKPKLHLMFDFIAD